MSDLSQREIDDILEGIQLDQILRSSEASYSTFALHTFKNVLCDKCDEPTKRIFLKSTGVTSMLILDQANQPVYTGKIAGHMIICCRCKSRWYLQDAEES